MDALDLLEQRYVLRGSRRGQAFEPRVEPAFTDLEDAQHDRNFKQGGVIADERESH